MSIDGPFTEEIATIPCAADAECGGGRCRTADVCLDVEAHRLRGLVLLAIGLVCFGVVAVLALMSARSRRRPRS